MATIVLPTARSRPAPNLSKLKGFIYGPAKIGKSEFCSGVPASIFLPTEKGLDNIACFKIEEPYPLDSWDALKDAINAIVDSGKFGALVIDTIDNAYRLCGEFVCRKRHWENIADPDYGRGYAQADIEFESFLRKLTYLDMGVWLTSHATERDVETRTGKIRKVSPTLRDSARRVVLGWADVILYAESERAGTNGEMKRVIRTKPALNYEAGDRTGLLPDTLPLSWSEFAKCFDAAASELKSRKPEPVVGDGKHEKSSNTKEK